jgi:carotenoid cleavage dioxygenase-like enzyme
LSLPRLSRCHFELPAQFVFHFVNAYEQGNEVVFESMRYPNADIFNITSDEQKKLSTLIGKAESLERKQKRDELRRPT